MNKKLWVPVTREEKLLFFFLIPILSDLEWLDAIQLPRVLVESF